MLSFAYQAYTCKKVRQEREKAVFFKIYEDLVNIDPEFIRGQQDKKNMMVRLKCKLEQNLPDFDEKVTAAQKALDDEFFSYP